MKKPTSRFSDRVGNYVKYRPSYPGEIINILADKCGLTPDWNVADIGSGTGIFSKLLLENGNKVFAVEPNLEMRLEAEKSLSNYSNFISINAAAESTSLKDKSIQMITVAQAFHWFNNESTRKEFERILEEKGWIVLIWNRRATKMDFEKEYEDLLLKYSQEYHIVDHKNQASQESIGKFYFPGQYNKLELDNFQSFDFEGLRGRLLSSSYAPAESESQFHPMMKELENLFSKYNKDNSVIFNYKTEIYYGRLK